MNKAQKVNLLTKVKFLALAAILTASGLQAAKAETAEPSAKIDKPTPHEICKANSSTAHSIMESRQKGVPMYSLMEISDNKILQGYIMSAFEYPKFSTYDYKARVANNFRDQAYLECMKELK